MKECNHFWSANAGTQECLYCQQIRETEKRSPRHTYANYLEYIKNAGGRPTIEWFDEDWSPSGPQVRADMKRLGLIMEIEGRIYDAK